MNADKVKEALEDCAGLFVLADGIQSFEDFEGGQPNLGTLRNLQAIKNASLKAQKALAELEKPAEENARIIAIDISLGALDRAEYWEVIVPKVLQQYAESYHAKKCAECVGSLPAFHHKPGALHV